MKQNEKLMVIDACLLAGKIMMQSGAETYRAEDTMIRMAAACGFPIVKAMLHIQESSSLWKT